MGYHAAMNEYQDLFQAYRFYFLGGFLALIALEFAWSRYRGRSVYKLRETATNMAILAGTQVSKALTAGWNFFVLMLVYDLTPLRMPQNAPGLIVALVFVDFLYYWQHRILHEIKFFWAFHLVHHSSPELNLTTSFRLNWLSPLIGPFFFLPAALLGFHPAYVLLFQAINLVFQFPLHTTAIGKLGFLEGVINTPSAHRVHHASNAAYIDKNYGGILMIWDRMFGTYVTETEPVRYGVTTGFMGHNPVKLVFGGFVDYFRGRMAYKG